MANDIPRPSRVGGAIPYFFFDAIGRIVPGAYLIVGMLSAGFEPKEVIFLKNITMSGPTGLAASFFTLLIASYFIGFVLGPISWTLEAAWRWKWEWSIRKVRQWYGMPSKESPIEQRIQERFKFSISDDNNQSERILRASWLCQFYVYNASYQLGIMATRWDAESLAARNVVAASLFPFGYSLSNLDWWRAGVFFFIGFFVLLAYRYHRKKQLMGRFDLFLACSK